MDETVCDKRAQDRAQNMALIWTCRMKQRAKANKLVTLHFTILDISPRR